MATRQGNRGRNPERSPCVQAAHACPRLPLRLARNARRTPPHRAGHQGGRFQLQDSGSRPVRERAAAVRNVRCSHASSRRWKPTRSGTPSTRPYGRGLEAGASGDVYRRNHSEHLPVSPVQHFAAPPPSTAHGPGIGRVAHGRTVRNARNLQADPLRPGSEGPAHGPEIP